MKFLLDQDVYATTARFLISRGHDVITAAQLGLSRAEDEELLRVAHEQGRVLLTRDRDYGHLIFVRLQDAGVIYLRGLPHTQDAVHDQIERVLQEHDAAELAKSFVVIEPHGHRIRRRADQ